MESTTLTNSTQESTITLKHYIFIQFRQNASSTVLQTVPQQVLKIFPQTCILQTSKTAIQLLTAMPMQGEHKHLP